jgi:MFS family permease
MKSFAESSREAVASPVFLFLAVLTIANAYGFQSWRTLLNNFMVEQAALNGSQNGIVQSVREVPGFLTLLVIYVLLIVREQRLAALAILVMGVGVALTGLFPAFLGLVLTTLLMSFGFHYHEATGQSLALQHFGKHIAPWVLGKLRSYMAATNLVVGVFILFAASRMDYDALYLLFGLPVVAVGAWAVLRPPFAATGVVQEKRMVLRRRYLLYYLLTFVAGARRQVFVAFAMFLAVQRFGFSIQEVTGLFVVNNLIAYLVSPLIGRCIMRFGERNVLVFEYASLFLVFLGYAFAVNKFQLAALYILDHVFFNFKIALATYFHKVADPRDIAPTVAVSFTINHIAAVIVPAAFGLFWLLDYRIPFVLGALMSLGSLGLALRVRIPPRPAEEPTTVAPEPAS